ncbi:MAG: hypothetical protein C4315_00475 [Chloroflexota bacterium]
MQGSRVVGAALVILAVVVATLYIWGLTLQSYWALAAVVTVGLFAVLGLMVWVGITLLTAKIELPEPAKPEANRGPASGSEH